MDVHRDSFTLAQSGQFYFGTFCCHFAVYNVFNNVFESFESSRLGFLFSNNSILKMRIFELLKAHQ